MRRPPEIRLIGEGLDAILIPITLPRRWWERLMRLRARSDDSIRPPSQDARLTRYHDAALLRPMYRDPHLLDLREIRGWDFLKAWRANWFPRVNKVRHLHLVPTNKPNRSARSRG